MIDGILITSSVPNDGDILSYNTGSGVWVISSIPDSHTRQHTINNSTDHTGLSGTTGNFMALDSNGLPSDSGKTSTDFVTAGLEDTFICSAGRNAYTTSVFLRGPDRMVTNVIPFVLPFNSILIAVSAATTGSETWIAEIYRNGSIVSAANLSITSSYQGYGTYSINFNAGDEISIRCNSSGIDDPMVTAIFRRR